MHQEEDQHKSSAESCNLTAEKLQRELRSREYDVKDVHRSRTQIWKRPADSTPRNSPLQHAKTPESQGSSRKDVVSHLGSGSSIQKSELVHHHENLEKINKSCTKGKFVNTFIEQWAKHMGVQIPLTQTIESQESPKYEEMKRKLAVEEQKIQLITKKLKTAEETISSISAARDAETLAKEEILKQLNSDWILITNYYTEISESLKGFKEHKDNLYKLYNNITVMQETAVKKLQKELNDMKLKDAERTNICAAAENKVIIQEKRMQEMMIAEAELKKLLENVKSESTSEKNRLKNAHAEERVELIKEQEKLTSMNVKLQGQLKSITEEKQNLNELLKEKDEEISVLQQDIVAFKNKIEDLLSQTADLSVKYEKSVEETNEFKKELESKLQETNRLRENLKTRQEVEVSLSKNLRTIETNYKKANNDFVTLQNQLKDMEVRNSDLQNTVHNMTVKSEHQTMELIKKIESLEKEKEKILFEKSTKIKDLENSCKLTKEKYEADLTALKKDFDSKLYEIKYQTAVAKFNDTLNRVDEHAKRAEKNKAKETQTDLNKTQSSMEVTVANSNKTHNIENQAKIKQDQPQAEKTIGTQKITRKSQQIVTQEKEEEDIYSFSTQRISDTLEKGLEYKENISDFLRSQRSEEKGYEDFTKTQKKNKIFKTRGTGLKQYTTTKKLMKK